MNYAIRPQNRMRYIFTQLVKLGTRYILKHNVKSLVIGESGGIDSALTTVLCNEICKELRNTHQYDCKLIGLVLPFNSNTDEETQRGIAISEQYCNEWHGWDKIGMEELLKDLTNGWLIAYGDNESLIEGMLSPEDLHVTKVRIGNIKARLRMIQLYQAASANNGIVMSTDNFTEYMLGFWTLHGDVGDLGLLQNLWKTEVYKLAIFIMLCWVEDRINREKIRTLQACSNAIPTDGLGITKSDFDQLGYRSYAEIDLKLIAYLKTGRIDEGDPVIKRHLATAYKRNNPYNLRRRDII